MIFNSSALPEKTEFPLEYSLSEKQQKKVLNFKS